MNDPQAHRPDVNDPRVVALAKARQQMANRSTFNAGFCPPWDNLTEQEQRLNLLDARNYLRAAIDAELVPAAPPSADQAALRDRIAAVLRPHASLGGTPTRYEVPFFDGATPSLPRISGWKPLDDVADAILAMLPPIADRAAVLTEAAVFVEAMNEGCGQTKPCASCDAREDAAGELRRLADEERDEREAQAHLDQLADELAAAIASCPGRELSPNPCRCPCYGCKHHCGAHDPSRMAVEAQQQTETEAHPAEHAWAAELYDPLADQWVPGTRYSVRDRAVNHLDHAKAVGPTWKDGTPKRRRLVRATMTYTVEQPAVVAAVAGEVEAHPPTRTWKVESPRRDRWASWGAAHDERDWARESYDYAVEHSHGRPFRLVRATTMYTVEAEHTPAVSQPGKGN